MKIGFVLAGALALGPLSVGCSSPRAEPQQPSQATPPAEPRSQLRIVEASKVCMVNNHYMGTEQIRVDVDGKTYFGCCDMCRGRLNDDPSSRYAKDPVSGVQVDKATAVIAALPSGQVRYFENAENARRFEVR